MNIYITKLNGMGNTMQYIQHMTTEIAHHLGFREMGIYYYNANAERPEHRSVRFDGIIAGIQAGDIVVCQFHTWNGLKFERALVEHIKAYRGRVIIFIHSLEALMIRGSRFMLGETVELYNQAEALIVPSYKMKKFLVDSGLRTGMKIIVQEMWDYIADSHFSKEPKFQKEFHYMGNSDAEFIKKWDYDIPLKLYASTAVTGKNVHSAGIWHPDTVLYKLSESGFGLEWYHDQQDYDYMGYGNSFSLSRYLAAGIPVIVPTGISCQKLIEENHLGLVVDSIDEAIEAVESMGEDEYRKYVEYVRRFSPPLRNGYYTKKCLIDSVLALFREDIGKEIVQVADVYDLEECKFTAIALKKSYGGNLALSWNVNGKPDGFLVYDTSGKLIEETENSYQHYFLIKRYDDVGGYVVKAYVNTQKGKMIVAKSDLISLSAEAHSTSKVSVVIPAYNAENYIVRCIDTVLAQSLSDLEIVVVDDGSTDYTPGIIDWYAENYSSIKVIHQENAGLSMARNAGIEKADGEYIAFVDSDDMIRPDMIERLYVSAKTNHCDIAITSGYQIESKGYTPIMQYPIKEDVAITIEDFVQMYAVDGYALPAVWNKLYRTTLVKEHLFPQAVYEDEAWTPYVLSYAERICYLNANFYEYDRSDCGSSLIDKWARKSKDKIFLDHKKSILFYMEHGNPKRLELLKKLAKSELALFSRTTAYDEYGELWKQIEGIK